MGDDRTARWYRLTPDRVVLGLLAVEGVLLLSEWFGWFAFNQHKGYTVLIAVAAVAGAMLLVLLWFLAALVFRLRFQFSILSLLVLAVVVAIPCSWLETEMKKAKEQREAVEWFEKGGRHILYDYQFDLSGKWVRGAAPPGPHWLRELLGDGLLVNVRCVEFPHTSGVCDAELQRLHDFSELQGLDFTQHPKFGDAELRQLNGLARLRWLSLYGTGVTDTGLKCLKGLTRLQTLLLGGTNVTDAGLEYLKGLTKLEMLDLSRTQVTDAGVRDLRKALPKTQIIRQ
ncbi:MAG: hypothetical protein ACLQLG_20025 [Thermoguttaceae bacterium]